MPNHSEQEASVRAAAGKVASSRRRLSSASRRTSRSGTLRARAARPEGFWAARRRSGWIGSSLTRRVLEWKAPWRSGFLGGKLNVTYNCVDRHAASDRRNKAALVWEGEPGDSRVLTFGMLEREVNRFATC